MRRCWWHPEHEPALAKFPVATADLRPRVNLHKLQAGQKRAVWKVLKEEAPALADLLADELPQEMAERFGAVATVLLDDLPERARAVIGR